MAVIIDKKLARQIVFTVNEICDKHINLISPDGIILASTDEDRIDTFHEIGKTVADTLESIEVYNDSNFIGTKKGINLPIFHNKAIISVIGISGEPDEIRKYANLVQRITSILIRERELNQYSRIQSEKRHFIMQSLTGDTPYNQDYLNVCLADINFNIYSQKRLIVIEINERYNVSSLALIESEIENLFKNITPSISTYNYPYEHFAIIDDSSLNHAISLLHRFLEKHGALLKVAIGKSTDIYELRKSYESALVALRSIKNTEKSFVMYDDLLLDLVISDMKPENAEALKNKTIHTLDDDDIELLKAYFKHNMSLAKTAESTFLHKNTIQYRLNKITEKSNLNPRTFSDAVSLYLAIIMHK